MSLEFNILEEATKIADLFKQKNIEWAFVGGIAVGIHGYIRATDDMDIIIHEKDLPDIDGLLTQEGYLINESPISFSDGYRCFRRLKFLKMEIISFLIC